MKIELICVGSELTSGKTLNTNASYISKKLRELGHSHTRQFTVDDDMSRISELVLNSLSHSDVLIITGGLGPTDDDLTKEAVCHALGLRLVENKICKDHIEKYFSMLGKVPTPNNYKQATAPEGAQIFKNDRGTACGMAVSFEGKEVILLPGPPKELTYMFETYIVPHLKRLERKAVVTHTINIFGMGESAIETAIKPLFAEDNPVVVTYCKDNECEISITATADLEEDAERICSAAIFKIKALLGDVIYGTDSTSLAYEVVNLLKKSGLKIATAESCTGGMLSQMLTSVQGASEVVEIGITAYSNRIKNEALSVPLDVLMNEGAISAETAMYLAKNVRMLSDADIGVGITGNAGPTANENKPVGLVYIAIADRSKYFIKKLELPTVYSRDKIRSYATLTALDIVRKYIFARPNSLNGMRSYDEPFFFEETSKNNTAQKHEENFAVFEVDEKYDFDADENILSETPKNVELDINSFISEPETKQSEIFNNTASFIKRHWIKLVCALVLLALLISSTVLVGNLVHEGRQIALINQARDEFDMQNQKKTDDTGIYRSFKKLIKSNSDIKGWITIKGTNINNPVYQSTNNTYYQNNNMLKEKSRYGALFFDKNNIIEKDKASKNITVYGHNTTNGTMFGELDSYHSLSFYKNNPVIQLKTLYQQDEYLIFSVFITNADAKDDNGQIFNYARTDFKNSKDFKAFINEAKKRSLITVPININDDAELLTLSTRSNEFENARFVVIAVKITTENFIGYANKATLNNNTKHAQAWYDKHGLPGYQEKENEPSSEEVSSNLSENGSSDNASDNTSEVVSSVNPANCNHVIDKYEQKDAEKHVYKCTNCGTSITEAHSFTLEKVGPAYLASEATCTSPAIYFKSCKCLIYGTETFQFGNPSPSHIPSSEFASDDVQHWNPCQNAECAEKLNAANHDYVDNKCACGKEAPAQ